ncbi:hypothetical protein ONK27_26560, partial [Salmonella enterica subsp. enterica serovar Virginia]|nr:hypothetical protein [Salmonella enterica subsp. enterica serovar Virginia]
PIPEEWNVGTWLLGSPLLRHAISGGDDALLAQWETQWHAETIIIKSNLEAKVTLKYADDANGTIKKLKLLGEEVRFIFITSQFVI